MKKIIYLLLIGIFLITNVYAEDKPCSTNCDVVENPINRQVTVTWNDCVFIAHYKIYYCEGPPPQVQVHFEWFEFPVPVDDDCGLLDPSQLIPLSYDSIVQNDEWFAPFLEDLPCNEHENCITNVFESYDAACWEFKGADEHGDARWEICDPTSCCKRRIYVCRHAYPDCSIYTVPQYAYYATFCTNPSVNCILFCDENQ